MTGKQGTNGDKLTGRQTISLSGEWVERCVQGCIRLLLSAVLSGAAVLDGRTPFGAAMAAASGSGILGGCAALGACLGSLFRSDLNAGLRYASAAMLTFAAAFAFYDIKVLRRPWTMPLAAGAAMAFTGLVAHARVGWTEGEVRDLILELALTVGAVWCFRAAVRIPTLLPRREGMSREQRGGLLVLAAAILVALVPVNILGLSLGRCLGGVLVLWSSWLGGNSAGAVWGAVLGFAMDLAGEGEGLYALAWPLAGLAAGGFGRQSRVGATLPWTLTLCAWGLWYPAEDPALVCVGEGLIAVVLLLALPKRWLRAGEQVVIPDTGAIRDPGGLGAVRARLEGAAQAYQTLCHTLKDSLRPPENDADVSLVFDRAAGRVCRGCRNWELCWQREYSATFNALNDATAPMLERGQALGGDFPPHFAHRCVQFSDFLAGVNEELTALFYRRQYQARVRDNRRAVCQQYDQLAGLLWETAEELGGELIPDLEHRRQLRRYLAQSGGQVQGGAYRDGRGLLRLRLEGAGAEEFSREKRVEELSRVVDCPLRVERQEERELTLVEQEPFKAVAGVAARKKDGETVSGDAGTYFKRPDGMAYLLLCDGMGSGERAERESGLAIRLLEQFLGTGIPAHQALRTLTSALALRGEETGAFTTVDLLEVDLFTGEAALYKLGAAPTYVRQGDSIRCLTAASLPAGLADGSGEGVDRFRLRLSPGDHVLMVSDGVCGTGEDGWLLDQLRAFRGDSPRKLAARLIAQSPQGPADDQMALVVRLDRRT